MSADVAGVEQILTRLATLGVPENALTPVREWMGEQQPPTVACVTCGAPAPDHAGTWRHNCANQPPADDTRATAQQRTVPTTPEQP